MRTKQYAEVAVEMVDDDDSEELDPHTATQL
jgi:hypothetical protein